MRHHVLEGQCPTCKMCDMPHGIWCRMIDETDKEVIQLEKTIKKLETKAAVLEGKLGVSERKVARLQRKLNGR